MEEYGEAIGFSIASAQIVFTIAQDAKSFFDQLGKSTSPDEVRKFLDGWVNMAQNGLSTTKKALKAFKDVRCTLTLVSVCRPHERCSN